MVINFKKSLCIFICLFFIFVTNKLFSLDTSNIIAYPVPFNPGKHTSLTIEGFPSDANRIQLIVFDVNGDTVFTREYSSPTVIWNGRNGKGKLVRPGLYILKITAERPSGDYGKKIIRILVSG